MSNDRTGILWVPGFAGLIGVREDGATVNFGGTSLTVSALSNVAGEVDQFAPATDKVLTLSNTGTIAGGDAWTLAIAAAKTLTVSNTLTFAGTDSTVMTFPSTTGTVATIGLANTWALAQTFTTAIVPTGGVGVAGGFTARPSNIHTGGLAVVAAAGGTDTTPAITETYYAAVFIPSNMTITGVRVLLGSATEGNIKVGLFNSAGAVLATSATTDISAITADTYAQVAFTGTYAAVGPATYYVGLLNDSTSNRFRSHALGAFPAAKTTGETYATGFTTIASPATTFTTALGPIATLY
jgi:hypothetical protein